MKSLQTLEMVYGRIPLLFYKMEQYWLTSHWSFHILMGSMYKMALTKGVRFIRNDESLIAILLMMQPRCLSFQPKSNTPVVQAAGCSRKSSLLVKHVTFVSLLMLSLLQLTSPWNKMINIVLSHPLIRKSLDEDDVSWRHLATCVVICIVRQKDLTKYFVSF